MLLQEWSVNSPSLSLKLLDVTSNVSGFQPFGNIPVETDFSFPGFPGGGGGGGGEGAISPGK